MFLLFMIPTCPLSIYIGSQVGICYDNTSWPLKYKHKYIPNKGYLSALTSDGDDRCNTAKRDYKL